MGALPPVCFLLPPFESHSPVGARGLSPLAGEDLPDLLDFPAFKVMEIESEPPNYSPFWCLPTNYESNKPLSKFLSLFFFPVSGETRVTTLPASPAAALPRLRIALRSTKTEGAGAGTGQDTQHLYGKAAAKEMKIFPRRFDQGGRSGA